MKSRLSCIALLIAGGLAVQCKADYLFTYQDNSGNVVGFSEPSLQASGQVSNFLFDENSVNSFVFEGNAPATCDALVSLDTGCTGLATNSALANSLFTSGAFTAPGVYDGSNGAIVDIIPYSGYLFTYQDTNGNIVAFSEPTLQISGGTSQFLYSLGGPTSFSFSGDTTSCGAIGSVNPIGCTQLNNSFAATNIFPAGSFATVGTITGGDATVHIVQATAAPEPSTVLLFATALIAGLRWRRHSCLPRPDSSGSASA